jgi:hypothetical protein
MNPKIYEYDAVIKKVPDMDAAYVEFPFDVREEFGKGTGPKSVLPLTEMSMTAVNMGVKNADCSICYIIGLRKDICAKIGKQAGDSIRVTVRERE